MAVSSSTSRKPAPKHVSRRARVRKGIKISLLLVFLALSGGVIWVSLLWKESLNKASGMVTNLPEIMSSLEIEPTVILSSDGKELFRMAAENRDPVRIEEVPQVVRDATLAAEDKRFYGHSGIDYWAIGRVLFTNAREGRLSQGGSTLTMQIAKRVYSEGERTYQRKVQDMALAVMMERKLTKDQILELYLNQVFYGSGAYGIQAAARVYFGKSLDQLTASEAATLARCVRRPSQENPFSNKEKALQNRNIVLGIMREEKMITDAEYQKAINDPLKLRASRPAQTAAGTKIAPYFVDYVLDQIQAQLPDVDISRGGYRIETTLNLRMQENAEDAVRSLVRRNRRAGITTGAFLLTDRDGRILAMVGGVNYDRNQFNVAYQGRRQPGSSFKPFVYAAAFEMGELSPQDSLSNAKFSVTDPGTGKVWSPKNSSGRFGGMVSVRTALAMSLNVPAVRVIEKIGPDNAVSFCQSTFGFTSRLDPVLPMVLGSEEVTPMELAQGYSVFQLHGDRATPFGVRRVYGPDGSLVIDNQPLIRRGVMSEERATEMDALLRSVVTSGTATRARGVVNARGKTGTTSENRDAWFIGYTDTLVGVGWIASERRSGNRWVYDEMPGVYGGTYTIQMWTQVMKFSQEKLGEKSRTIKEIGRATAIQPETPVEDPPARELPDRSAPATPDDEWTLPPLEPAPRLPENPQPDDRPKTPPPDPASTGGTEPNTPPTSTSTTGGGPSESSTGTRQGP
ncbi:MAG TPA: PBP1A family penicillin-binding protein [Fimbriimonadaceae bacterium]|nr:PBP1A family penicillin-binding protein [Fimbriimonadaceae bacterium]